MGLSNHKISLGVSHGLAQISLEIGDALEDVRRNTMTSLTWIRLEVKKGTVRGLGALTPDGRPPYSAVAEEPDRVETILTRLESKMAAVFEREHFRPRALNFGVL